MTWPAPKWRGAKPPRKFRPGELIRDPFALYDRTHVYERGRLQSVKWIVCYQFSHVVYLLRNGLIRDAIVTPEWLEWNKRQQSEKGDTQ